MPNEFASSVEAIDAEAEKILEEARTRASEILRKGREEAKDIVSSQPPMDDVKEEYERIIHEARAEADKKIEESRKKASEISTSADSKVQKVAERIVDIITGAKLT